LKACSLGAGGAQWLPSAARGIGEALFKGPFEKNFAALLPCSAALSFTVAGKARVVL